MIVVCPLRIENGPLRLFWYSLYISLPNLVYELALFSQLFRHQDRQKILNDDFINILDINLIFFQGKNYAV